MTGASFNVRWWLATATLLLGGCAGLGSLGTAPRVSLVGIEPVQIQLLEQRFLATLRIQNPNAVALPIDGLEYAISINDSEFATGVSSQRVTVPAFGEKKLTVGVTSNIVKLLEQIRRFGDSEGAVRYAISGTLGIRGMPTGVPFLYEGEVDFRLDTPPKARSV